MDSVEGNSQFPFMDEKTWLRLKANSKESSSTGAISYPSSVPGADGLAGFGPVSYNGLQDPSKVEVVVEEDIFAESTTRPKGIQLPGDLGMFLGRIEQKEYALVLRGAKGAGKSRLTYQLMNLFASQGFLVGNFSLEMPKDSIVSLGYRDQYIAPENRARIKSSSVAPEGIQSIRESIHKHNFNVVVIDSFSKVPGVKQSDFDELRKEFPKVFWLVIFQSTTTGSTRGGVGADYDAGAVIQVEPGGIAMFEKNRYATEKSMKHNWLVFDQMAVSIDKAA